MTIPVIIFDLDETLTDRSSFTGFLLFAARRTHWMRPMLLPLWVFAMLGYKAGLYDRGRLKQFGLRLMLGRAGLARLGTLGPQFADRLIRHVQPGARALWDAAGAAGYRRVIATAAIASYAGPLGTALGADAVVATRVAADGTLVEGNCYGGRKLERVQEWLSAEGLARADIHVIAASDSFADAPLLNWADQALFVTRRAASAKRAEERGWLPADFGQANPDLARLIRSSPPR